KPRRSVAAALFTHDGSIYLWPLLLAAAIFTRGGLLTSVSQQKRRRCTPAAPAWHVCSSSSPPAPRWPLRAARHLLQTAIRPSPARARPARPRCPRCGCCCPHPPLVQR